ncbi:MAG: carbon-nitrogen hydrolase [Methylicorpusculum sp.]|uniref:carbon-nitrogen hydrolase n=1 Tax=Methylicorpusculum sp. TaxID=2713644 RepID=UPI002727866A|nr:carbon-nitrogen hydrolase [Methylicorpusculum sp.]MDO8938370.1 carbon-nitrogen hydrolase [Methylicorpusculum sp.]MDP2180892.1 carbon-nitrogen hydrolase [Methylicorpusculum sp.]MDP2201723.1 carbon-nitrogen hydrolase [Methylicorpusculum sp.]MDP3528803.1 carbon-nitrogen hydrolase [Methylicorpusculum sp.]MDZ4150244.1 carbon-nitrogen hydrolase [Methylicorpusculum sp.]
MKKNLTVSAVQQPCDADKQTNLNLSIAKIHEAKSLGADLVVLPELHLGPYFCQSEDYQLFATAESIPGPTTAVLSDVANELDVVIVSTIFEKRAPGLYHNTAVVFDKDGTIAGKYRKMHIPDDPGFYEKYYFTPGDIGFKPIETSIGKLGVMVCWDQWFPEGARLMALAGAELLIYPTAIGWDPDDTEAEKKRQMDAWITIQRAHAVANGIPVIACNRIGFEQSPTDSNTGIDFWGNSFITGPQGEVLVSANATEQKILTCEIDWARNEKVRQIWPYLRDRRIDEYGDITKRFID